MMDDEKEYKKHNLLLAFSNHWEYKHFTLGFNLCSQFGEYYMLLSLGFWQISIGFYVKEPTNEI